MFPNLARDDFRNRDLMQAINFSKLSLCHCASRIQFSNRQYIVRGQFCTAHALAFSVAVFLYSITNIVSACAEKQMGWVDAPTIIASMTGAQSIRNVSVSEHPCKPMGFYALELTNNPENAITLRDMASPSPARSIIGFIDFSPKSFNQCSLHDVTIYRDYRFVNS